MEFFHLDINLWKRQKGRIPHQIGIFPLFSFFEPFSYIKDFLYHWNFWHLMHPQSSALQERQDELNIQEEREEKKGPHRGPRFSCTHKSLSYLSCVRWAVHQALVADRGSSLDLEDVRVSAIPSPPYLLSYLKPKLSIQMRTGGCEAVDNNSLTRPDGR